MKVFVSYSHVQGDWVWDRLVPCLKAGGAEVLIDRERFRAGGSVYRQMDATQNDAQKHVLVLSAEYLASKPCQHEMRRAIAQDPGFTKNIVLPIRRDASNLPRAIRIPDPIYVDLRDDTRDAPWNLLLRECGEGLGTTAPVWLMARDRVKQLLQSDRSVNLVTSGDVKWRELINDITLPDGRSLPQIDLEDPAVMSRRSLIQEILRALGEHQQLPPPPDDLPEFGRIVRRIGVGKICLLRFDIVHGREHYDSFFFAALRYLITDTGSLVVLIHSQRPFLSFLPADLPVSRWAMETVVLSGL